MSFTHSFTKFEYQQTINGKTFKVVMDSVLGLEHLTTAMLKTSSQDFIAFIVQGDALHSYFDAMDEVVFKVTAIDLPIMLFRLIQGDCYVADVWHSLTTGHSIRIYQVTEPMVIYASAN